MEKKEDNTFLYAFLVVTFVFLAGIAFIVTRPNTENSQEQEVENPGNNSNSNTDQGQVISNKFPSEVIDAFSKINSQDEYRFISQSSFRSYVENEAETSTKIFSSATQFIFDKDNFRYSVTNREGNSRNERSFSFEDGELFELKTGDDMILVEDESFSSNLISTKDLIKDSKTFFINENLIQNISLEEDGGNDIINVLLVDNGVLELIDQGLIDSIKNFFKVEDLNISAKDSQVKYIISEKSLIREINIGEITVKIDSSRSFSVRDLKTVVEYSL